jgi:pimeloyl-ACP methyl ester carboxylesterase
VFVLVHGAFHGSWCWTEVQGYLSEFGADSLAVDLPGRAGDGRSPDSLTLDSYVDSVVAVLEEIENPVRLVGHGMSGLIIGQVAEAVPDKVASLVYLTALLLNDGESAVDVATRDSESRLIPSVSLNPEGTVDTEAVHKLFYGDCRPEVSRRAARQLVAEPIAPSMGQAHLSGERWGSVPRTHIVYSQDRAISAGSQRQMIDDVGVDQVVEMDTSHSPFLSQPDKLAAVLMVVAD